MEPQVKKIFGKLPKTELATEKVELALIDDLKSMQKEAVRIASSARDAASKVEKAFRQAKSETEKAHDKVESIRKEAFGKVADARTKAKEIGVELPKELYDRYDEIEEALRKIPITLLGNVFPI